MKISLAWIFDHIQADYRTIDVPALMTKLSQTTAEVENYRMVDCVVAKFSLVTIQSITNEVYAYSPEWLKKMTLSKRTDAREGAWYLVVQHDTGYRWATSTDLGGEKEMIVPALEVTAEEQKGKWKKSFERKDYIIEIDNKSINHRPDLWGHRGFAREIAALLGYTLKPLEQLCASLKVIAKEQQAPAGAESPFTLVVENSSLISRFAGLSIPHITSTPSYLWMVTRLSRIDSRSLNGIVDSTNYVMFDTGQPLHAFDADQLSHQTLIARRARNKEMLTLLDDRLIELDDKDIVIADGSRPVSLAGIMGGKETSVRSTTTTLFIESAHFDPATIRKSAQHHKIRTEASARFEKNIDPNDTVMAIQRFLHLLNEIGMKYTPASAIISLGKLLQPPVVEVSHQFIESRLGTSIAPAFVEKTLTKLEFQVKEKHEHNDIIYKIMVPSFRATKDIAIKEDIVEEVGRFYGYDQIRPQLPLHETKPTSLHAVMQQYKIKQLLAFGLSMRELYTYAFFDESFLQKIGWEPAKAVKVKDPVSGNWYRLVTTLIPNMFKAIAENYNEYNELRFFEWARAWMPGQEIEEKKLVTGIFYTKRASLNFYDMKAELDKIFVQIGMPVQWRSVQELSSPWFDASHTAQLEHNGELVGVAGMVDSLFLKRFADGSAFIFELNGTLLAAYEKAIHRFQPLPRYPSMERDISMMVPLALSVEEVTRLMLDADATIRSVVLIDMFQKKEWKEERALTFRYIVRATDRTLTKEEADRIDKKLHHVITQAGATIR